MKRLLIIGLLLLGIFCASSSAEATLVEKAFSGWVTNYNGPADLFNPAIVTGSSFLLQLEYDTDAELYMPTTPGVYKAIEFIITIGSVSFSAVNPYINIIDNLYGTIDRFMISSDTQGVSGTPNPDAMYLSLSGPNTLFSGISLPDSLDLADFNLMSGTNIGISYKWNETDNVNRWLIQGNFIPPANAPVPEPATILLLGSGLVGLAGIRRKFKMN